MGQAIEPTQKKAERGFRQKIPRGQGSGFNCGTGVGPHARVQISNLLSGVVTRSLAATDATSVRVGACGTKLLGHASKTKHETFPLLLSRFESGVRIGHPPFGGLRHRPRTSDRVVIKRAVPAAVSAPVLRVGQSLRETGIRTSGAGESLERKGQEMIIGTPHHAPQPTRPSRSRCHPRLRRAGWLSLGCQTIMPLLTP